MEEEQLIHPRHGYGDESGRDNFGIEIEQWTKMAF
jgi:hypothetical protein